MGHAPYAILGDLNVIYGKTTKTACGRRVATDRLVSRELTDCRECQRQIAIDRHKMAVMELVAKGLGMTAPLAYSGYAACRPEWMGDEIAMSDCRYGCKVFRCRHCERESVVHSRTYGCRQGI